MDARERNVLVFTGQLPFDHPLLILEYPEAAFGEIARIVSAKFKELSGKGKRWESEADDGKERYVHAIMAAYR